MVPRSEAPVSWGASVSVQGHIPEVRYDENMLRGSAFAARSCNVDEWETPSSAGNRAMARMRTFVAFVVSIVSALVFLLVPCTQARAATRFPGFLPVAATVHLADGSASGGDGNDGSGASGGTGSVTDNITDTQNLLGSGMSAVSDSIANVRRQTGVTVRLLYLPTFEGKLPARQWAEQQLEVTNPRRNTVLLAVASQTGTMVIVVSHNSDPWLRNRATVSALSDAAAKPLNERTPNWTGSALALCDEIVRQKKESEAVPVRRAWTITGIVLAVLVLVGGAVLVVLVVRRGRHGRHAGRHSAGPVRAHRGRRRAGASDEDADNATAHRRTRAGRPSVRAGSEGGRAGRRRRSFGSRGRHAGRHAK